MNRISKKGRVKNYGNCGAAEIFPSQSSKAARIVRFPEKLLRVWSEHIIFGIFAAPKN